ncbi:hypothetical protein FD19_GL001766 [Lacticaseibacillus thailandensis DSM 22698 = JCM 13996]|uniref:HAD superfamily hydrolase n=2 Tax=Lacticaseibacillus thailandensis TaxID=381741 RepID=A0A0R2CEY2_9LACO|nr:hypothetical protein FD19_GL001766 [Lacticaseibacillus thailandensis DSM 22698 = JCM 13996]
MVAVDINDTLLNSQGQMTDTTAVVLQQATSRGVKVVLTTSRPLFGIRSYLRELNLHGDTQYAITYNGALLQTLTGRVLKGHTMRRDDIATVAEFSVAHHMHFHFLDEQGHNYVTDSYINPYTVRQAAANHAGIHHVSLADISPDFHAAKIVLAGNPADISAVQMQCINQLGAHYYIVRTRPYFIEIMSQTANKGTALTDLGAYLGIAAEETMAIGDGMNDLPMLASVGVPVAMGNARRALPPL